MPYKLAGIHALFCMLYLTLLATKLFWGGQADDIRVGCNYLFRGLCMRAFDLHLSTDFIHGGNRS